MVILTRRTVLAGATGGGLTQSLLASTTDVTSGPRGSTAT